MNFLTIVTVVISSALTIPWPLVAQSMGSETTIDIEVVRAILLNGLEQHKQMDIEFARAIPDSALRWKPTPEVRDFAQQIDHIAVDNANFVVWGGIRDMHPTFGDSAVYLNDKAELERFVVASYVWVIETLRSLPPEELVVETELFGQRLQRWHVYLQALAHADWTRGQVVPYFRLNGMGPPGWKSY
ncbi:MAG: DinB family protein [Gemmatimonadetes bacterium]|nr:DinB family protein [Gemmatimonadota bacterium]